MRVINICFILPLFILNACSVRSNIGFEASENQKSKYVSSHSDGIDRVAAERVYESSGHFVQITHPNAVNLELFVPGNDSELDYGSIIKLVVKCNDASKWPFYYCPLGLFAIDSVQTDFGYHKYNDFETNIGMNELFEWQQKMKYGFLINHIFVRDAKFCLVKGMVEEINNWNFDDQIADGPEVRDSDENFFYMFDESVDSLSFLLPYGSYCGQ